jgi:expansin (peptidoglycan-binding protein)
LGRWGAIGRLLAPGVLLSAGLLACARPPEIALGETQQGLATFYDANGTGACGFDASGDLDVAAMNQPQFAGSAVCGACVRVTGSKGSVTVRIVDLCPECQAGHLDLSREAFAKVAEPRDGRVPIQWAYVKCDVQGPVQYRFKEGSSQYWTAIQIRNHRVPIQKLEIERNGWAEIRRESYNYFVDSQGAGSKPFKVRITSSDGQVKEDTLPAVEAGQVVSGAGQFE